MKRLPIGGRFVVLLLVLALVAGCGGSSAKVPPAPDEPFVAALGDSITAGAPAWDPDPGVRARLGSGVDPESQWQYWAQLEAPEWRFRNCGVSGERTDQIAERLDACAAGASVLVVQGGVNDIAQGRAVEDIADELAEMVRSGKERGLTVLLAEVLPWSAGHPGADADIRALNSSIRAIGARERVTVLPWYRAIEDPRRPGRMRRRLDAEGYHPSVAGYRVLGKIAAAKIRAAR